MYQRILVPVDGSPTAERGMREAIGLAAGQSVRLIFLHIVDDYTMLIEMSSAAGYEEMVRGLRQYGLDVLAKAKRAAEEAKRRAEEARNKMEEQRAKAAAGPREQAPHSSPSDALRIRVIAVVCFSQSRVSLRSLARPCAVSV